MSKNILSSHGSTTGSDDSFITPVSSVDDLMALSPKNPQNLFENSDVTSDFLTGMEFDSICDVTMQEIPVYDDMLIDGTSLDYLAKCAGSNRNQQFVDRGKESLFVKFDPLYANQKLYQNPAQNDVQADSLECDVGYETGSSTSAFTDTTSDTPKKSVSNGSVLSKCGKDKPTQVVPPVVTNKMQKQTAPPKPIPTLMRSVSAILTPTQVTTDRLISISGSTPPTAAPRSPRNKSFSSQVVDRLQSLRIILQNQDKEVLQLRNRQKNQALKSSLQQNQHNFDQSKEEYETKLKKFTDEKESFQSRESDLLQQVKDKKISNKQMCLVMEEYEKTISILIADQETEKLVTQETINNLLMERDDALKHLTSMESSFNDLLAKYEKCKSFVIEFKEREKILEKKIAEYEVGMQKYDDLYNNLKEFTVEKLDKVNETLDNLKKSHNLEIMKLNATIKKHEVLISSLQANQASISSLLAQKTRDTEELTRICDQLINEVR